MTPTPEQMEYFEDFVDKTASERGCWLWIGPVTDAGYGYCDLILSVHRFSWQLAHPGEVIKGYIIGHSCDVPNCVNPGHLFRTDRAGNYRDMVLKGRAPYQQRFRNRNEPLDLSTDYEPMLDKLRLLHLSVEGWS